MALFQDLDSDLWQRLPGDVLELVLLHLPLEAIIRFCAVCKRWSEYLLSPSFRASCRHSASQNPLLVALRSLEDLRLAPVLTSHGKKWQGLNLSFLHQAMLRADCNRIVGMGSDGGLLCVCAWNSISQSVIKLIVCNPLTQTYKILPPIDKPFPAFCRQVIVRVEQPSGHYQIFIFLSGLCNIHGASYEAIFLYSSRSDSVVRLPRITNSLARTCGAFQGDIFYTLSQDHELIAFDTQSQNWTQINTGITMTDQASEYKILVHDGHLFCAIAKKGNPRYAYNIVEFRIYELNLATRQCVRLNIKFQCSPGSFKVIRYDWDFVVHRNNLLLVARSRAYDPPNTRWLEVFEDSQPFPSLAGALCSPSEKGLFTKKPVPMLLMMSTLRLDLNQQVEFA